MKIEMRALSDSFGKLEKGLVVFDTEIPTILEAEIAAVAIAAGQRLVMIAALPEIKSAAAAQKAALTILYMWNFTCDFKEDFWAEVEDRAKIQLAPLPPRIIAAMPKVSDKLWPYLKNLRDSCIDIDVFTYEEVVKNGDREIFWLKTEWPAKIEPLSRAVLHRFNVANGQMAADHKKTWDQLTANRPHLRGYDRERTLVDALKLRFVVDAEADLDE